jgi:hypothetical protein
MNNRVSVTTPHFFPRLSLKMKVQPLPRNFPFFHFYLCEIKRQNLIMRPISLWYLFCEKHVDITTNDDNIQLRIICCKCGKFFIIGGSFIFLCLLRLCFS